MASALQKTRHPEGTYKTRHCENWLKVGSCRYGRKCQFAHGMEELRCKPRLRAQQTLPQASPAPLAAVAPTPPTPQNPLSPRAVLSTLTPLSDVPRTDFSTCWHIAEPDVTQGRPLSKIGGPPLAKRDVSFATKTVCGVACLALEEDSTSVLEALLSSGVDDSESVQPSLCPSLGRNGLQQRSLLSYGADTSESVQPPLPPSMDWYGLQQVWNQSSAGHQRSTVSCPRDTNSRIAAGAA